VYFISILPKNVEDLTTRTDAIVVLTGSSCRITTGAYLLAHGYADHLFISGVPEKLSKKVVLLGGTCPSKFAEDELITLLPKTTIGHQAKSTVENAEEAGRWIQQNNIKTIRLVTSAMHLPRSLIEFQRQLPDIKIIPHPVMKTTASYKHWYRRWTVFSKLVLEYNKFLLVHMPWLQKNLASYTRSKK
jgi:uncharacterized SAM-binding protein YcdF (DUF218 family)